MTKELFKIEKNVLNALIIVGIKIKKPITKDEFESNTMIKTEGTLIFGRSVCGKIFLMLSLLKDENPVNVYISCKTDSHNPSKYHNQSTEI